LVYNDVAENYLGRLVLYDTQTDKHTPVTTDRYDSYSPAWSPDGKWLWFLSDRSFTSSVGSPWGARQPDPYFDKRTKIYGIALRAGEEWPFEPRNELQATRDSASSTARADSSAAQAAAAPVAVTIDLDGITSRLFEAPVPAGNYSSLSTDGKRLYWMSLERSPRKVELNSIAIETPTSNEERKAEPVIEDVASYEMSLDRKKLMVRKDGDLYVFDAGAKAPSSLTSSKVDLSGWSFSVDPKEEWLHHFVDAWRLERDYFYDPDMHGVDWPAMRQKYLPLARRVTDRAELNDVIAQMVGELSALHIFVRGGDQRSGTDDVAPASLGAVLERDAEGGGWRVAHIYRSDPDLPAELSPLAAPGVSILQGDVILAVDGVETLSVPDPAVLLRNKAGRQVLLRVRAGRAPGADDRPGDRGLPGGSASPPGQRSAGVRGDDIAERDVIVRPITQGRERDLRYDEWEYTRRLAVDSLGGGRIGYVHLRAMGSGDIADWTREYYPVFNRDALIVDVRHNRGGNIDSWLLGKLLRRDWFWWQPRVGEPYHNMPYAFRGPIVVLVNERTASDGEAFAEGFRRLGLGKLMGTRTWGGEIWLSSSNVLADRGIATAAEQGVFADGQWLIEGWGVDPDTVVDNLPVATWRGADAQLEAAVRHLDAELRSAPVVEPEAPRYPVGGGREP
ncbi:MAG: S41 family peptidase, partial [Longimicrobiales bacterium]